MTHRVDRLGVGHVVVFCAAVDRSLFAFLVEHVRSEPYITLAGETLGHVARMLHVTVALMHRDHDRRCAGARRQAEISRHPVPAGDFAGFDRGESVHSMRPSFVSRLSYLAAST